MTIIALAWTHSRLGWQIKSTKRKDNL